MPSVIESVITLTLLAGLMSYIFFGFVEQVPIFPRLGP